MATAKAVNDIIAGKTKGDFADQSDFLTEKNGIDYLTNDKGSKITSALFWPLERMDYLKLFQHLPPSACRAASGEICRNRRTGGMPE